MNEFQSQLREEFCDEEYRYAYAEDFLNTWIATQIVTLREQRKLNQTELAQLIGTKQPGISRLENVNHSNWRVDTLKRIARALGVRLCISFETFGTLVMQDEKFCREYLQRPKFEDDPVFLADRTDKHHRIEPRMETESTESMPNANLPCTTTESNLLQFRSRTDITEPEFELPSEVAI